MTKELLRWGLAGYGDLSRNRLVDALNGQGSCLDVVWGRQISKAQAFADEHKIPRATNNLEELFKDVDAIYIATPVTSHVPIAKMALNNNLCVIVEKPLSPLLHSSNDLVHIAAEKQLRAAVAYYRRLMPAAQYVKDWLAAQKVGQLHRVVVEFRCLFAPLADDPKRWRCDSAMAGAGVMADAGSHRLDLLCWFFGKPQMLKACLKDPFPEGCERIAELELVWDNNLSVGCYFSWSDRTSQDFMRFEFEHGQLLWNPLDTGHLCFFGKEDSWELHLPPVVNPHATFVSAFCQELPCCSLDEAALVDDIIEAAVRSHQSGGAWINLSEETRNY